MIKLTRKKYGDKENIRENNEKNFVGNDNNKIQYNKIKYKRHNKSKKN